MKSRSLIALLILGSSLLMSSQALAGGWEDLGVIDGVRTKRQSVENSPLFAFRGERVADIPLDVLIATFADPAQRKHWVDRYEEHVTLEKSDLSEVYWIHFGLPPLISDRDYVLKTVAKIDREKGQIRVEINSTTHPKAPSGCCVRAEVKRTLYLFTALSRTKTRLMVEVHTDPKGMLPRWLVNLIQKSWPSKTLNGLVKHALKMKVSHEEIRGWLEEKYPEKSEASSTDQ